MMWGLVVYWIVGVVLLLWLISGEEDVTIGTVLFTVPVAVAWIFIIPKMWYDHNKHWFNTRYVLFKCRKSK